MVTTGFTTTYNKGFHITFANGLTVSVQFGPGNYCDARDTDACMKRSQLYTNGKPLPACECDNAEIAVFEVDGDWHTKKFFDTGGDDVVGHITPDQLLDAMVKIRAWKHP